MQLHLQVRRHGNQLTGSVRRAADPAEVEFWGVVELVAALEWLMGPEPAPHGLGTPPDPLQER